MDKGKIKKGIGARIKQLRLKKDITQEQLAKSIGKLKPVIQRIEGGTVNPTIYTLKQIAEGLGIKLDILLQPIE
jgi:transcriptional regulator with XRE-family HTH domain